VLCVCRATARLTQRCVYALAPRIGRRRAAHEPPPPWPTISGVSKLQIEERHVNDVTVIVLTGEMLLDDGDLAFRRHVNALVESSRLKIVVDLAGVTYIDSSGVGMMVAQLKTVQRRGGDIRLLRLNTRGQRLFGLLKLKTAFETFDDEGLAVRSFARRPSAT
jgi:anti-sigma B factor antagonist